MSEVSHAVIYLPLIATTKNPPRRRIRDGFFYPLRNYMPLSTITYAGDPAVAGIFGALALPSILGPS
jgi:hypothetical protein